MSFSSEIIVFPVASSQARPSQPMVLSCADNLLHLDITIRVLTWLLLMICSANRETCNIIIIAIIITIITTTTTAVKTSPDCCSKCTLSTSSLAPQDKVAV